MSTSQFWNDKFAADAEHAATAIGTTASSQRPIFAGDPNATIAELVEPLKPGKAIDLGSGRGRHVVWLARQGWNTTALDFSEVGLSHTKSALEAEGLSATLIHRDLTAWRPAPGSYDLVLCSFIHLPSQHQRVLWQKISEALSPGGYLVSVSHHPDNQVHGPKDCDLLYTEDDVIAAFDAIDGDVVVDIAEHRVTAEMGGKRAIDTVVKLRKN